MGTLGEAGYVVASDCMWKLSSRCQNSGGMGYTLDLLLAFFSAVEE
jgi:hypothetical protein